MNSSVAQQRGRFLATRAISSDQVYQGAVRWLPERPWYHPSMKVNQILPSRWRPSHKPYKHPILVLSRPLHDDTKIHFVLLTTLVASKGRPINPDPQKISPSHNHLYLPIEPTKHRGCCTALARYKNGLTSAKAGYVSFEAVYSMKWVDAKPYADFANDRPPEQGPWVLEDDAMGVVLDWAFQHDHLGYNPGEQYWFGPASTSIVNVRGGQGQQEQSRPQSLIARVSRILSQGRHSLRMS